MKSLKTYFNNKDFSDVVFIIQKQVLYSHKLILCSRSPYFSDLIKNNCKDNSILEIEIEDASFQIFSTILEYIYTDTITYSLESIWEILKGSKFYQLNELSLNCQQYILGLIDSKNVFEIWKNSQKYNTTSISEHCVMFILTNFKNELLQTSFKNININDNVNEIESILKNTKIEEKSMNLISEQTHSFNLWQNNNIPPTAFPTNETIQTFPQFFIKEDLNLEKRNSIVTRRLSIMDQNQLGIVLQNLLNCITKLFSSERTSLFLYDKETDELYSQVVQDQVRISKNDTTSLIGNSFKSGKILKQIKDSKYVICSPILKDNNVIGVLEVLNKLNPFTIEDETNLKTISLLLSILLIEQDQRRKSNFDLNFINDEEFSLNDLIYEKRNSVDFKLPNEDLDTSYNSLIRSYSISSSIPVEQKEEEEDEKEKKKRKIKNENLPFMHFRIPRYELQFINFESEKDSKNKSQKK